jgi:hypothetical protein
MGTIIGRTRKDGSKAFTAQIVIKKGGAILHRESQSFERRQAANAWIVKREAELKRPGGLERKEDPPLAAVIDRYIAESKNAVLGTKAQVLKSIKNSYLGEAKCSDITSHISVVRTGANQECRAANLRQLFLPPFKYLHGRAAGVALREVISSLEHNAASDIFGEGLLIIGWVAMWRPLEIFLYEYGYRSAGAVKS